jgi:hypothetical protein
LSRLIVVLDTGGVAALAPLDEKRAGAPALVAAPPPSGVDAIVAAEADDLASGDDVRIITSDGDDMQLLASLAAHAGRLTVVVV